MKENLSNVLAFKQSSAMVVRLPVDLIHLSRYRVRKTIDPTHTRSIANSIQSMGRLIHPVSVRPIENGEFELIVGEYRLRAIRDELNRNYIDAIVIEGLSEQDCCAIPLIENLQRKSVSVIEEATGYRRMMQEFGVTEHELAIMMGIPRPTINNCLRLLNLPEEVQILLHEEKLDRSAGKQLVTLPAGMAIEMAKLTVRRSWTAKQLSQVLADHVAKTGKKKSIALDVDVASIQDLISTKIGTPVKITLPVNEQSGAFTFSWYTVDQLDGVIDQLAKIRDDIKGLSQN